MSAVWHDLGTLLVARGLLGLDQLAEAERICDTTGARLEDVLVRLGYLTREVIHRTLAAALGPFTEILLRKGVLSAEQLVKASGLAQQTGAKIGDTLVNLGYATNEQVMAALAEFHGLPFIDLSEVTIPPAVVELVPESVARENLVLPLAAEGRALQVVMSDPWNLDTIEKLLFILDRDIRPVLAPRDQIIEAINRHYGQSETESVDSMLAEFTDTAIDFTEMEAPCSVASPSALDSTPRPESRPAAGRRPLLERLATVRYYHRMNPERMFPLLVVLSRKELEEVQKRGVAQARSGPFQVAEGSLVEIEPVLPGCACYPPKEQVRVGAGEASSTFWVVPHVLGEVQQARVVVRQNGDTLAEVPVQMRVVKQTLTVLVGALGLVLPFVLLLLKHLGLDFETQSQNGFALYARVAQGLLALTPELLAVLLLAGTVGLYLWFRPRQRDVFWDVKPAVTGEEEQPEETSPGPRDLLREADRVFEAGDFAAALPLYERALVLGAGKAVHHFRASLAAHRCGNTARALAILRRAEAELPAAEMKALLWYNRGCFAARLGHLPEAVQCLDRALDLGYDDPEKYRADPDLELLRSNGTLNRLLAGR